MKERVLRSKWSSIFSSRSPEIDIAPSSTKSSIEAAFEKLRKMGVRIPPGNRFEKAKAFITPYCQCAKQVDFNDQQQLERIAKITGDVYEFHSIVNFLENKIFAPG